MVVPNPAWPLLHVEADFTAGPPGTPGINRRSLDKANGLGVHSISTKRGRQYELGQCEAGTATLTVADPKEVLNPGNPNSPFMTGGNAILSRRQLQVWALWNTSTGGIAGNILNTANRAPGQPDLGSVFGAYGYDPSFENYNPGFFYVAGSVNYASTAVLPSGPLNSNTGFETGIPPWVVTGGTVVQSTTQKHSGTYSAQLTPNGTSIQCYLTSEQVPVVAGNSYCVNLWVWVTAAVTGSMSASITWFDANHIGLSTIGNPVSVAAGTWTQLQNTFVAPTNAAYAAIVPVLGGTPPASNIFYIDDASLTNATNPADGSFLVVKATMSAANNWLGWIPRATPGTAYTLSIDVYAPTGCVVQFSYGGVSTSTTVTGAYQTLSLNITATAGTPLQIMVTSAAAYPVTIYYAGYKIQGLSPGWSQTAGSAMSCTQVQAHSGLYSLGTVMAASTDSMSLPIPTAPTITYTMSAWVYAVGAGSVVRMSVGGSTASSSTVGAWQRLAATFVATDAVATVSWSAPSGTFPVAFYVDDIQLEAAATASAYTASGPTARALHTGYIERFPQTWTMQGSRGIKPLESVDALAVLSRTAINQSYASAILPDNPTVYIPYSDKARPQTVQAPKGGQSLQGYTTLGTDGSANFGGDTFLDGSPALSIVQQNSNPPVSGNLGRATVVGTLTGAIGVDPQSCTLECWARYTSGTISFGGAHLDPGQKIDPDTGGPPGANGFFFSTNNQGIYWQYQEPGGSPIATAPLLVQGPSPYQPDGLWHHWVHVLYGGNSGNVYADNVLVATTTLFNTSPRYVLNNIIASATAYYGGVATQFSVANMAFYSTALSTSQIRAHYNRGIGYQGELPGARVSRLLSKYWGSSYTAAQGTMKLAADYYWNPVSTSGQSSSMSVLRAIQDIVETENGLCYANAAGTVVFEDRTSRYNNQTSMWTFGENAAGGELPYDGLEYDFDPTYVYSQANLTRPGNTTFAPMVNNTTQANYGQAILSRQLQATTDFDLQQAGIFYLNRYGQQKQRIRKMVFSPGKNPTLFTAALSLEISNRVTVKRRASAGVTISGDFYVEAIRHHIVAKDGEWSVELELSPVFVPVAWVLGDATYGVLGSTTIPVY